jgi:hypothetical protein
VRTPRLSSAVKDGAILCVLIAKDCMADLYAG